MGVSWLHAESREDDGRDLADNGQYQQWQINLLDHIDAVQDEVSHRMDFIERELDGKGGKKSKNKKQFVLLLSRSKCPLAPDL